MAKLDDQLAELEKMTKADLGDRWAKLIGRPVPRVSEAMLRLALAYEVQTKALGGLSRKAKQRLEQVAAAKSVTTDIRPGMRLAREHGGKVHVVTIGEQGQVLWNEREWRSQSEVARGDHRDALVGSRLLRSA